MGGRLWLITILIHLFLLVSGVVLAPPIAPAEGPGDGSTWRLPPGSWPVGLVILLLVLQPDEAPPFPWLRWRVRWVVRRRRLADMTLEQLLALLPPGVRTIAQLVDWLTRSQPPIPPNFGGLGGRRPFPSSTPSWPNWTWRPSSTSTAPPTETR